MKLIGSAYKSLHVLAIVFEHKTESYRWKLEEMDFREKFFLICHHGARKT